MRFNRFLSVLQMQPDERIDCFVDAAPPLRFLFVSNFEEDVNSGAAGSILAIGTALTQRGHSVEYVWRDTTLDRVTHPRLFEFFLLPRLQYLQIQERLKCRRFDAVIVSQPYAYLVYERLISRFPQTVFLNRTHGWEARIDAIEQGFGLTRYGRSWRRPFQQAAVIARRRACLRTARSAHAIIAPSSRCATFIREEYGLSEQLVATIPYGFTHALNSEKQRLTVPLDAPLRLLYVGQYMYRKGSDTIERVLPLILLSHPDVTMTFVVQDSAVSRLQATFCGQFGERVSVHGWTTRNELSQTYLAHDVLVFPTLAEGFGKTFLEAMAFGLCVVGFDEGGLGDICTSGEHALFCEPNDVSTFLSLLDRALTDPAGTRAIGRRAQLRSQQFTWNRTAEATELFARGILEYRTNRPAGVSAT